jgi:hypothetical protein
MLSIETKTQPRVLLSVIILVLFGASTGCRQLIERTYTGPNDISITNARGPLPDGAFKARIELPFGMPIKIKSGEKIQLHLVITNLSDHIWPGEAENKYAIKVGNHWLDSADKPIQFDDGRGAIPFDIMPGRSAEVLLPITTPKITGKYTLEIDAVQEGVAWFAEKGSSTLRLNVVVENPV